jgi:hypothetical protein
VLKAFVSLQLCEQSIAETIDPSKPLAVARIEEVFCIEDPATPAFDEAAGRGGEAGRYGARGGAGD